MKFRLLILFIPENLGVLRHPKSLAVGVTFVGVVFIVFCTSYYDAIAFGWFNVALILADSSLEHDPISKLELDEAKEDAKLEPVEVYKEGMVVPPREDGRPPEPPEGFTIHTTESGVMVLRRKRQRNLQKLGKLKWTY